MIREATKNDFKDICRIAVEDLGYNCEPELVKQRLEQLDTDREKVFVIDINGAVVGFVHAEKYNTLYYKSMINIQGLAIAKSHRKNGYGKALMETVENWARDIGVDLIRLNSGSARKEAHSFYRKIGYNSEKEQIRFMKTLK